MPPKASVGAFSERRRSAYCASIVVLLPMLRWLFLVLRHLPQAVFRRLRS